jgi:hypothetical protein
MSQQPDYGLIGLREQELREALEDELVRAIRAEGEVPTIHAIAHSVAHVLEPDHLRMAEQLRRAGVRLEEGEDSCCAIEGFARDVWLARGRAHSKR